MDVKKFTIRFLIWLIVWAPISIIFSSWMLMHWALVAILFMSVLPTIHVRHWSTTYPICWSLFIVELFTSVFHESLRSTYIASWLPNLIN